MRKKVNHHNWLEPDDPMKDYVKLTSTGSQERVTGQDWLYPIPKPKLLESVSQEVHDLFEGARGALVYGYFYYPLYFLGTTELYRVAEAAVAHKCKELNAPASKRKFGPTFDENIKWLASQDVLQLADWELMPSSRNFASHLKAQEIITPAMAIMVMEHLTRKINDLFPFKNSSRDHSSKWFCIVGLATSAENGSNSKRSYCVASCSLAACSSKRFLAASCWVGSNSTPKKRWPSYNAAASVEPTPIKGQTSGRPASRLVISSIYTPRNYGLAIEPAYINRQLRQLILRVLNCRAVEAFAIIRACIKVVDPYAHLVAGYVHLYGNLCLNERHTQLIRKILNPV